MPGHCAGLFMYIRVPVSHVTLYALRVRVTLSCYTPDFADCASLLHSDWRDLRKLRSIIFELILSASIC